MAKALPLKGIRVANFGWVWAGPVAGQTLAFLGAEVYKIESRARIDINRTLPPFAEGVRDPDRSLQNHAGWAGNGSVSLNLKEPRGARARAAARLEVRRGDRELRAGRDGRPRPRLRGSLRAVRPDIVMLSMPAAGLDGPLRDVRTYGMSLTSLTGLDSVTGYIGGPPVPMENAFSDPYNGVLGAFAVLVALTHRKRTGKGQHIDYSQQEAVMQLAAPTFMDYVLNGRVGEHDGQSPSAERGRAARRLPLRGRRPLDQHRGDERRRVARACRRDGIAGVGARAGVRRCERAVCATSMRCTNASRRGRRTRTIASWRTLLQEHGVAAAPVLGVGDLLNDPQYKARKTFVEVQHPLGFRETIYGAYVKMSRTEADVRPGPAIGQDNEHVFKELLGLSDERYQELVDAQVIY